MGRFNVDRYDPATDSSPSQKKYRTGPDDGVIVVNDGGQCHCGCEGEPAGGLRYGGTTKFMMGHDIKLRGKLIRAHLTGNNVTLITPAHAVEGKQVAERRECLTALAVARRYDTEHFSWVEQIKKSAQTQGPRIARKLEAANKALLKRATGIQEGDRRLVKIGRWEYTGQVMAIFATGNGANPEVEIEYVDKKGATHRVRKTLDGLRPLTDAVA